MSGDTRKALKRIPIERLEPGMYVHEICAHWTSHPFWRTSFLLTDTADVAKMREAKIREVWIDTARGKDVAPLPPVTPVPTRLDDIERGIVPNAYVPPPPEPAKPTEPQVSMSEEMAHAVLVCARAKQAVVAMFSEARMGKAINTKAAAELVNQISDSVMRHRGALVSLVRLKRQDEYSYMHSVAVCALMIALARELGFDEEKVKQAGRAGLLHDLGKAVMPLEVLNKPGKLTDAEYAVMRQHPERGYELLREAGEDDAWVLDVCLHHHEHVDGNGYPHRQSGAEISEIARMGAICDVYDAITSNRPYKAGWDPAESIRRMSEWKGHFDERLFHAFVRCVGIYPAGSLVRLTSGRLAIVLEQGKRSLLEPRVRVFYSTRSNSRIPPETLDLSSRHCKERVAGSENPADWKFDDLHEVWLAASHEAV